MMPAYGCTDRLPLGRDVLGYELVTNCRVAPAANRFFSGSLTELADVMKETGKSCPGCQHTLLPVDGFLLASAL